LQSAFRHGFDLLTAKDQPIGYIHTLYFYQVEKSIQDAKEREAKEKSEQTKQSAEIDMRKRIENSRRLDPKYRKRMIRPVRNQEVQHNSLANVDAEDLIDAFEEAGV
jgi:hypothetical protein